jgi:hypothetical protein
MLRRHRHTLRPALAILAGLSGALALIVGLAPGFGWGLLLIALALAAGPAPQRPGGPTHRGGRARPAGHARRNGRRMAARGRHR